MELIKDLKIFTKYSRPIFLALGNFDGIHKGHSSIIKSIVKQAQKHNGESWVFSFNPHPLKIIKPNSKLKLLTTVKQKSYILSELNLDGLIIHIFNKSVMNMKPEDFFYYLFENIPTLMSITVGEEWSFGRNKTGNTDLLSTLCKKNNIAFNIQKLVNINNHKVSSTNIRKAILNKNISEANKMLGRYFSIIGKVIHGKKIGRQLGYPTANINTKNECIPPSGIYSAYLVVDDDKYDSALYIGVSSTLCSENLKTLEIHLINEKGIDLYDKEVEVKIVEFIRDDQNLENIEKLKKQISIDIKNVRKSLFSNKEYNY